MKKLTLAAAMIFALGFASQASAGGFAGSRFSKGDCTYTKATNVLYCEARFTSSIPNSTATILVSDSTCVGTETRVFRRTGTLLESFRAWAYFTGHVARARNEIVGDEDSFEETWAPGLVDEDLGCLS
jgi:hypothetical protein